MSPTQPESAAVTLSDAAARQIAGLLAAENAPVMLRVAVSGGGCSGFQYGFTLDDTRQDDDLVLEKNGATVLIDSISLSYMGGAEIDYVDDLIGAAFQVKNPNATASCGCGTSFSV